MDLLSGFHTVVGSADDCTGQAKLLHAQLSFGVPQEAPKLQTSGHAPVEINSLITRHI